MQEALTGVHLRPLPRAGADLRAGRAPGFVATLAATWGVLARHPLPILICALVCFAGAGIIGALVYAVIIGESVIRTGSHSGATVRAFNTQALIQAILGTFLAVFGRGAISWIALQDAEDSHSPISLRRALGEALKQWQPLLLSTVVYGAVIMLGLAGLTVLLRELRLDVSNVRWVRGGMDSVMNWTMVRAIAALPPEPGSPFADWLSAFRYNLARTTGGTAYFGFDFTGGGMGSLSVQGVIVGAAAVVLLVLGEALLCMRSAAVFAAAAPGGAFGWLQQSVRVSGGQLGRVLAWRWGLRLIIAIITIAALVLPPALHQGVVMNEVRRILGTGYWPFHIAQSAYGVGIAIVAGMLTAFSVAFEARMFAALSSRAD